MTPNYGQTLGVCNTPKNTETNKETEFEKILNRINNQNISLLSCVNSLDGLAVRLLGPIPEECQTVGNKPASQSEIERAIEALEETSRLLSRLGEVSRRLNTLA